MLVGKYFGFLNGDSFLGASRDLESYFQSIFEEKFLAWLEGASFTNSVREGHFGSDVTMVSADEIDQFQRPIEEDEPAFKEDEGDHPDKLGVYVRHHPWSHRPAILVSPEKVMAACLGFGGPSAGQGSDADTVQSHQTSESRPMMSFYPALLAHVAFHELAHAGMCEAAAVPCHGQRSWQAIARAFDAGERHAAEAMLESALSFTKSTCNWRPRQRLTRPTAYARHTIEESLANAISLRQRYDAPTASLLRKWVSRQPPSYRAGLHWKIDEDALYATASSWRHAKPALHAMDANQHSDPELSLRLRDFHAFAARLRSGHIQHDAVDFCAMLRS